MKRRQARKVLNTYSRQRVSTLREAWAVHYRLRERGRLQTRGESMREMLREYRANGCILPF